MPANSGLQAGAMPAESQLSCSIVIAGMARSYGLA